MAELKKGSCSERMSKRKTRDSGRIETYGVEVGDGGVRETEDTVDGVAAEGARERGHGGELLRVDGDTSDGDGVGVDGAGDSGAVAVLDGEGAGLLLSRVGLAGGVPVLGLADGAGAGGAGDPEIGGAGVEVDEELLGGGADGDRAGPLGVALLVGEGLGLALGKVLGKDSERLDGSAGLEDVGADVLLEVDQVRTVLAGRWGRRGASALHVYVME